jgi:transposase-like protein
MRETRRKFDADFREGAVRLVRETGKPIAQVARDTWPELRRELGVDHRGDVGLRPRVAGELYRLRPVRLCLAT